MNSFGRFYIAVPTGFCYLECKKYCKFKTILQFGVLFPQFWMPQKKKKLTKGR